MKSSKILYSESFIEYRLSDDQLAKLQTSLFDMMLDLKELFDRHNINYMLSGGTMLGAVRHHGFIPWDDDVDIMMLRSEYEKFKAIFNDELGDRYILAEPLKTEDYYSKMPKIYKKGTTFIEVSTAGTNGPQMLFIDVFIIENVPCPGIKRDLIAAVYDFSYTAASVCVDFEQPSPVILDKAKTNEEVRRYYNFRRKMGAIFSVFGGSRTFLRLCERVAARSERSGWMGIPAGIRYKREIFPETVFTDLTEKEFCGKTFKIPAAYDQYLKNLYGDYMKMPSAEDREYHTVYKMAV